MDETRANGTNPFEAAAHRATVLVGDGCVIRRVDGATGRLRAVAADHRDSHRRRDFRALLEAPPLAPDGWVGQALERRHALRLPDLRPHTLVSAGAPADERVGDAIVVPAPEAGTVILALRDRVVGSYSGPERCRLEEIAALLDDCVASPRRQVDGDATTIGFDPESHRILDATSAALWVVDRRGRTLYVNEAASELIGLPANRLVGIPTAELLGPPVARPRTGFYGKTACDRALLRADGTTTWVTATARPLFDAEGAESGCLYTLVEIGDRRRREIELRLRLQRNEALLEIASGSVAGLEGETLLDKAVSFVAEQLAVELVVITSFDPDTEAVRPLAWVGWEEIARQRDGAPRDYKLAPGSAALAALEGGEPVLVGDYERSTFSRAPEILEAGVRSGAYVPFVDGDMVLAAHSMRERAIDGESLSLIESVVRLLESSRARAGGH